MTTYIALLRGINVGGQKRVGMNELKELFSSMGFANVQTYIQSGNAVFDCTETNSEKLAKRIEQNIQKSFGFDVLVFTRTKNELGKIIESKPFPGKDATKLHVTFLSKRPANFPTDEIIRIKGDEEEFSISGKEIYLFLPHGYGTTKLSNNLFERKLNVSATTRNWNTVNTLYNIASKAAP